MQSPQDSSHPAPVGSRILVVDDNRVNRALLASRLKNMGLCVISAEGGQEALNSLEAQHADLVLLDIEMPGLSGFEVLARIRERFTRAQLPVVMVTAHEDEADVVRALSEGANDYVFKKSDFAVIRARVEGQLALKRALDQLHESRSMESISIITGGIAHEINTPLQYINDNASFIDQAHQRLSPILDLCEQLSADELSATMTADLKAALRRAKQSMLRRQLPAATAEILSGIAHIAEIINALQIVANPRGDASWKKLHDALHATITIARGTWRPVATLAADFDAALDRVQIDHSSLHKVVLALLVNAAQAIALRFPPKEESDRAPQGRIHLRTQAFADRIEVSVQDNGPGIDDAIRDRIFDPFFTTHDVGQGSGQGLPLCRSIVVQEFHGSIAVSSELGLGSSFTIRIPRDRRVLLEA